MRKINSFFLLLIALALVIQAQDAKIDEAAPAFKLKDSKGKEHSLSDFKGKFVVLEWINYDCPFVKKHYDSGNMQKLQKEFTEKGVVWLAICSSAPGKQGNFSNEEITKRSADHNAAFSAYLIDENGETGKKYGAKTTPHMYVINPEGILIYAGGIDDKPSTDKSDIDGAKNYVAAALNSGLNGKQVEVKLSKPYGCSVKY
ncbi:MAG: thioredoxin family protein [Ignavibacteriales bacterium]|nr:thioredoxin family protein [Ignavibacteriales bacterium]MCF8306175.1 thioredoxin family protein [Ignavibacteriales bacterium]MCF8315771.1 thioredoxin family protein [Ignavibacteriales bacterium]MCF8437231.1 thioredoxin family protein [Ignavibacteriales bacterium]